VLRLSDPAREAFLPVLRLSDPAREAFLLFHFEPPMAAHLGAGLAGGGSLASNPLQDGRHDRRTGSAGTAHERRERRRERFSLVASSDDMPRFGAEGFLHRLLGNREVVAEGSCRGRTCAEPRATQRLGSRTFEFEPV
jgi:hypothetical protein